jgi:exodeoxyribonuclease V beta subunit
VIKKPKESIFDEINLTPVSRGVLQPKERQNKEQEHSIEILPEFISHYGVQETPSVKEEEEKEYQALLFGTALHYGLEMLSHFAEESIEDAITAVKNRYGGELLPQNIQQIKARIARLIQHEGFQTLLTGAQIRKEQAISFEGELKQIDLLLAYEDGYVIVDYKSSKKFAHKHQEQVKLYQRAIESITGKQSQGVIVYLEEEQIELVNLTVS